jgi:hypothetical protein
LTVNSRNDIKSYTSIIGFLSDFELIKSSKKINIISKASREITIPGSMAATNSIERNSLERKTFIIKEDKLINNSLSLLFYHKNFPNYKKLLFFTSQKNKIDILPQKSTIFNGLSSNKFLYEDKIFKNESTLLNILNNQDNIKQKLNKFFQILPKNKKLLLRANKQYRKKLLKTHTMLKVLNLRNLFRKFKLRKLNSRILLLQKQSHKRIFNQKNKKNFNAKFFSKYNKTTSNLFKNNFFRKKFSFYSKYSLYFLQNEYFAKNVFPFAPSSSGDISTNE